MVTPVSPTALFITTVFARWACGFAWLTSSLCEENSVFNAVVLSSSTYEPRHEISNNLVCVTSKASEQPAQSDQSLCKSLEYSMNI